ncbi:unnamed protein product, partial [Staurois parvus]
HVISSNRVKSQLITDHQGTDDQCGPSSATCHCPSVLASATSMPHISAYQCTSMPPISAHLSCFQCLSVPPISASQCRLLVPYIGAAFPCPSVMSVNAHQCH